MRATGQVVALAVCLISASWALAQSPPSDHLKCYKIKDPLAKASYAADVGGLLFAPGCTIKVPAITACVPATKTHVEPPPGGGPSGTPNAFFCYKVKCPEDALPTLTGTDQFGTRTVTPKKPTVVCAPVTPTPPWCTSDAACGSGLRCSDGRCGCDGTSCPNGCCCVPNSSNACLPGTPVPSCLAPNMQTDTDCGTGGIVCQVCVGGTHCDTSNGTCAP